MKRISKIFACLVILGCMLGFSACSDDDDEHRYPVTSISIVNVENRALSLENKKTFQLVTKFTPEDAFDVELYGLKYSSSNNKILTVNNEGIITGVSEGIAYVEVSTTLASGPGMPVKKTLVDRCEVLITKEIITVAKIELSAKIKDGWRTTKIYDRLDLPREFTLVPDTPTVNTVTYESSDPKIASVTEKGGLLVRSLGTATITIASTDGGARAEFNVMVEESSAVYHDRKGWTATSSHPTPKDPDVKGSPDCVIDGDLKSCLVMVQNHKTVDNITVPLFDKLYFTLDMQKELEFNCVKLTHRLDNDSEYIRAKKITLEGSNDGENFEMIQEDLPIDSRYEFNSSEVHLEKTVKYRMVRVYISEKNPYGSTVQVSEFEVGLDKK